MINVKLKKKIKYKYEITLLTEASKEHMRVGCAQEGHCIQSYQQFWEVSFLFADANTVA